MMGFSAYAETVVVDFDDLEGFGPIPAGYAGFENWGSWAHSTSADETYFPRSGETFALSVGAPAPIVFGQPFAFSGAWFTGYANHGVLFELYVGGELVHTSEILMIEQGFHQWLGSGYDGAVDEVLVVNAVGANFWCMDDLTYEDGTVATTATSLSSVKRLFD